MAPQRMVQDIQKLLQLIEEAVSQDTKDGSRIMSYLKECRQYGIEILPLDINRSGVACAVEDEKNIRLGFSTLVSGGSHITRDIVAEREQNGHFRSFQAFCERVDLDSIPEEFITRCVQSGAFDSVETSRSRVFLGRETIIRAVHQALNEQSAGQIGLFEAVSSKSQQIPMTLPDAEEWTDEEKISHEKEAMGFSFTEYLFHTEDDSNADLEGPSSEIVTEEMTTASPAVFIIQLAVTNTQEIILHQLREIIRKYSGNSRVVLEFIDEKNKKTYVSTHPDYSVDISAHLAEEIEAVIGEKTTRTQHVTIIERP